MRSFRPYDITLTLSDIQSCLNDKQSMPENCFNIGVRFRAFREYRSLTHYRHEILKHYTDIRFSVSLFTRYIWHSYYHKQYDI